MSLNSPLPSRADSPASALRGLASWAHRMLRQGGVEDRDEVRDLLDEIERSRRLFERVSSDELAHWFDQLEAQVAELIDPIDGCLGAGRSACGVGAA